MHRLSQDTHGAVCRTGGRKEMALARGTGGLPSDAEPVLEQISADLGRFLRDLGDAPSAMDLALRKDMAARALQRCMRGKALRRELEELRDLQQARVVEEVEATCKLQAGIRGRLGRKRGQ